MLNINNIELQDDKTAEGGVAFAGETLGDFLTESNGDNESKLGKSLREINEDLTTAGIKPIAADEIIFCQPQKLYVISIDWAKDGDCEGVYGSGVRGVYASLQKAQAEMERIVKDEYRNNIDLSGYEVERTATEFVAYRDGEFATDRFCVYINEREIEND